LPRRQHARPPSDRARHHEHGARQCRSLDRETRVLLLHRADPSAGRNARDAGGLPCEGRCTCRPRHHLAFVHVLRGAARLMFFLASGGVLLMNGYGGGWIPFGVGFFTLVYMLFGWFGTVIRESEGGLFNGQVDMSFRWAMGWFIFSEVMFFGAFFGALFYARIYSVPWLGDIDNRLLWPD